MAYSTLLKPFEKQIKTIRNQRIKQVKALKISKTEGNKQDIKPIEAMFRKGMRTNEIKNKINEIKK